MFLFYSSSLARPVTLGRADLLVLARALISSHSDEALPFVRTHEERARSRCSRSESELWRSVAEILDVLLRDTPTTSANDG